jgi:hypothetical protein
MTDLDAARASGRWRDLRGSDWGAALRYSLLVYLCVRVALLALGVLAVSLLPLQHPVGVPGWPAQPQTPGWHNAVTGWERADALWFLRIASDGYRVEDGSPAFFPLFPLLVRAVGWLAGGRYLLGGFVVANVSLLVGLTVLYKLTAEAMGDLLARRTVLYLCVFPTAFFLFSPFSEPLFLALVVGSVYAARHERWLAAGLLGAGAAATRSVGIVLCAVLLVEAVQQLRQEPAPVRRRLAVLGACALPAAGLASYLVYWQVRGPSWDTPFHAQGGWERHPSAPWRTLQLAVERGSDVGEYPRGDLTLDLVLVGLALVLAVWVTVRSRPAYSVYVWLSLLFPLLLVFDGRPLMSVPRFLLPVFPLFWALARFSERWRAHDLVVTVSAAGLALLGAAAVAWLPIF